jgi:hypothetical protein
LCRSIEKGDVFEYNYYHKHIFFENARAKGKNKVKKKKKKYVKPRIKSEKIFETAALACGKCTAGNPITGGACFAVTRLS